MMIHKQNMKELLRLIYYKTYNKRPEVKDRKRAYNQRPDVKKKKELIDYEYRQTAKYKEKKKQINLDYNTRPEIRKKKSELNRANYLRKNPNAKKRDVTKPPYMNENATQFRVMWYLNGKLKRKRFGIGKKGRDVALEKAQAFMDAI
jgi:hypothetical protein